MSFLDSLKKRYRIEGTDQSGMNTGRRRYFVQCLECGEILHEATTGTKSHCIGHDSVPCISKKTKAYRLM